jgi:hypothetical protein
MRFVHEGVLQLSLVMKLDSADIRRLSGWPREGQYSEASMIVMIRSVTVESAGSGE